MVSQPHQQGLAATQQAAPILVVDGDLHLRQMLQWVLEDEGFEVKTAADGQDAVEQARAHRPRLVVLDVDLPLLAGNGVAQELRAQYGMEEVPIVLITADGRAAEKGCQVGAISFLRKPFEIDELVHAVQQACSL
jgi:DNA-binding response OmpR family regulator